jgi:hypothetical protein
LSREEALQKKIEHGTIEVPPMLFTPELQYTPLYWDPCNALVVDAQMDEASRRAEKPW